MGRGVSRTSRWSQLDTNDTIEIYDIHGVVTSLCFLTGTPLMVSQAGGKGGQQNIQVMSVWF